MPIRLEVRPGFSTAAGTVLTVFTRGRRTLLPSRSQLPPHREGGGGVAKAPGAAASSSRGHPQPQLGRREGEGMDDDGS